VNKKQLAFQFIEENEGKYPVATLIKVTGCVSRAGYYKWKKEKETRPTQEMKDKTVLDVMLNLYIEHGGNLGSQRFKLLLDQELSSPINLKRINRMRKKYGLLLKTKRRKVQMGQKHHVTIANLLNRNFKALRPGLKYCIDISYLEVKKPKKEFIYLCAITDLYNNEIVAYQISEYMDIELVKSTVRQLKEKGPEKGAIIHSDQGTQFTSPKYTQLLKDFNLTQSMSRRGNCWDNACIESFFGKLKTELFGFSMPETKSEVIEAVHKYITYYNEKRPQLKLKMSPLQYRMKAA